MAKSVLSQSTQFQTASAKALGNWKNKESSTKRRGSPDKRVKDTPGSTVRAPKSVIATEAASRKTNAPRSKVMVTEMARPWTCAVCTFINSGGSTCEMCKSARPPTAREKALTSEANTTTSKVTKQSREQKGDAVTSVLADDTKLDSMAAKSLREARRPKADAANSKVSPVTKEDDNDNASDEEDAIYVNDMASDDLAESSPALTPLLHPDDVTEGTYKDNLAHDIHVDNAGAPKKPMLSSQMCCTRNPVSRAEIISRTKPMPSQSSQLAYTTHATEKQAYTDGYVAKGFKSIALECNVFSKQLYGDVLADCE